MNNKEIKEGLELLENLLKSDKLDPIKFNIKSNILVSKFQPSEQRGGTLISESDNETEYESMVSTSKMLLSPPSDIFNKKNDSDTSDSENIIKFKTNKVGGGDLQDIISV